MRPLFVVMCNLFLVMYLTMLTENERAKDAEQALLRAQEEQSQGLRMAQADSASLEQRLKKAEADWRTKSASERAALEAAEKALRNVKAELGQVQTREAQLSKDFEKLKLESAAALKERDERLQAVNASLREAEEQREQLQKSLEQERKQLEDLQAVHAKTVQEKDEALQRAAHAETEQQKAVALAAQAAEVAEVSKDLASRAALRAESAASESRSARDLLRTAGRSIQPLYERNIAGKLVSLNIKSTGSILLGSSRKDHILRGVPLSWGDEAVLLIPLAALASHTDARVELRVNGRTVEAVYASPWSPRAAAVVLPDTITGVAALNAASAQELPPVLVAVHQSAGKDDAYFSFSRDDLVWRGNGEAGFLGGAPQPLLPGDQILDPEGNFVGIAVDANTIRSAPNYVGWRRVSVSGKTGRQISEEIRRLTSS